MKKVNIKTLQQKKGREKIVMITAYDALFAKLFAPYVDIILVGDSLNMVFAGKEDTLSATMEQMIYHTQAVCAGAKESFILFDMPYGSYTSKKVALKNAIKVYKETCADAIKLEGGREKAEIVRYLVKNGIAVCGHIGLMPQSVRAQGGYRIVKDKEKLIKDAKALERAGAFMLIVEGIKAELAVEVRDKVKIPVIGIGAGKEVDGQVLVWSDMLGFFEEFKPKFVRRYLQGANLVKEAVKKYQEDVRSGAFPSEKESY